MSDWSVVCEAIRDDLTASGRPLEGATVHLYAPWSPEELDASDRKRHVAIWPRNEAEATLPEDSATGQHTLLSSYVVMAWEQAFETDARAKADEVADKAWLQLHNDIRARFYVEANQQLGSSNPLWYAGAEFPEEAGRVRWMRILLTRQAHIAFV